MNSESSTPLGSPPLHHKIATTNKPSKSLKRKREDESDKEFREKLKNICSQFGTTYCDSFSASSLKRYRNYSKASKEIIEAALAATKKKEENLPQVLEEISENWEALNILESDELEEKVKSEQDETSYMLKITVKNPSLLEKYINTLKRVTDAFIHLGQHGKADPLALSCITKRMHNFKEPSNDEIFTQFSIDDESGPEIISIPKSCLLNLNSPYFMALLTGPYKESFDKNPIKIGDIDIINFKRLKNWIINRSLDQFDEIDMEELIEFMALSHRFDLPELMINCDSSLGKKIEQTKKFHELVPVIERLTLLKREGYYESLKFYKSISSLLYKLSEFGLDLSPNCREDDNSDNLFSLKKLTLLLSYKFLTHLETFSRLTLLEGISIELNLSQIIKLKNYEESLTQNLPQVEALHILIKPNKYSPDWKFLFKFKNLKRVKISFSDEFPLHASLEMFKLKFPKENPWHLSFVNLYLFDLVENYTNSEAPASTTSKSLKQKKIKTYPEMSFDHFIELETLKSDFSTIFLEEVFLKENKSQFRIGLGFSQFRSYFSEVKDPPDLYHHTVSQKYKFSKLIEDSHVQKLIEAKKFDPETTSLDLSNFSLSDSSCLSLFEMMPKLEKLTLLNVLEPHSPHKLSSIYDHLPSLALRLKEITLPSNVVFQLFTLGSPFFQNLMCFEKKSLIIHWDDSTINVLFETILQMADFLLQHSSRLRVEFTIPIQGHVRQDLIFDNQIATLKTDARFRHSNGDRFTKILEFASKKYFTELELNCSYGLSPKMLTLLQHFPFINAFRLKMSWLNTHNVGEDLFSPLQALRSLQTVTLICTNEIKQETYEFIKIFQASLSLIDASIHLEGFGMDSTLRKEAFIQKSLDYKKLIPNFNPFYSLAWGLRESLTDEDLLSLKPERVNKITYFDFSGMSKISAKGILKFLRQFPDSLKINFDGCLQVIDDMINRKLSLEDCLFLLTANIGSHSYNILWILSEIQDQPLQSLCEANRFISNPDPNVLDLSDMRNVTSKSLEYLLEKWPQLNELRLVNVDRSLYKKLPDLPRQLQQLKKIVVPIEILMSEKETFLAFLKEFKSSAQKKKEIVFVSDHVLKMIPEMAGILLNLSNHFDISFVLNNIGEITLESNDYQITLYPSFLKKILSENTDEELALFCTLNHKRATRLNLKYLIHCDVEDVDKILASLSEKFACEWIILGLKSEFFTSSFESLRKFDKLEWLTLSSDVQQDFEELLEKLQDSSLVSTIRSFHTLSCFVTEFGLDKFDLKTNDPREYMNDYINKCRVIMGILPNYNPFPNIPNNNEVRALFNDEHLALFKPKKLPKNYLLDFSGMVNISLKALSEFIQGIEPNFRLNLKGCTQIEEDIENCLVSVDEFIDIEALKRGYSSLLINIEHPYRPFVEDRHIIKLYNANKISPKFPLNLLNMPLLTHRSLDLLAQKFKLEVILEQHLHEMGQ